MKRLSLLFILSILLIGCTTANSDSQTLFGALSARFQLGSTEETLSYKQIAPPYMITSKGEVLQDRGAAMTFDVSGLEAPINPETLTITFNVCAYENVDGDTRWEEPLSCQEEGLIAHTIGTVYDEASDLFVTVENDVIYHEYGDWLGEAVIEDGVSGETTVVPFEVEVYESRPPTTTRFELTNLLLPFVVIGLFLLIGRLRNKPFITPLSEVST